jgi:hypothetical protein
MRLWSIKICWLDSIGLVALWREALLAKAVLKNSTEGYKNHPQLVRFREYHEPLRAINTYLLRINEEADRRGFAFNAGKIDAALVDKSIRMMISQGQLDYELALLKYKLRNRSIEKYKEIANYEKGEPNDLFVSYKGPVEAWEKTRSYIIPK